MTVRGQFGQHYFVAHRMHVVFVFGRPNMQTLPGCKGNLDSGESRTVRAVRPKEAKGVHTCTHTHRHACTHAHV